MSDAQQRAAEVMRDTFGGVDASGFAAAAAALAAAGLLVDDDTARLVRLGRAVENAFRFADPEFSSGGDAWNRCLDAIYREAERMTP